jgi:penicillin-binding protein 2
MATVINGGYRVLPYVDQARRGRHKPKRVLSDRTLEILQKGMRKCVEKEDYPSGTGRYAKIEGMVVMGKTGTAQVVPRSKYEHYENEEDIPYLYRDNALFIAGVPGEEPPIAISIIIEHGLHGSTAAAPRAKQIIEFFYRQRADHVQVAKREESS